jgi:hypothetical protein
VTENLPATLQLRCSSQEQVLPSWSLLATRVVATSNLPSPLSGGAIPDIAIVREHRHR